MVSFLGPGILAQNGILGTMGFSVCFVFPLHVIMSSFIFKWFEVAGLNLFQIQLYLKITFNGKKMKQRHISSTVFEELKQIHVWL